MSWASRRRFRDTRLGKRWFTDERSESTLMPYRSPWRWNPIRGEEEIRRQVTSGEGDVNERLCGVQPELLGKLDGKVDVVLNLAGLVEFDPPLTDSLVPNVYGVQNLLELVKRLGAKLIHISTCYVAGKKNGRIPEDTPILGYYPKRQGPDDHRFNVAEELRWCEQFVEECKYSLRDSGTRAIREQIGRAHV